MSNKRDFYEVLGVTKSATQEEIKKAYRKKALEFHPDRNKEAGAEAKFKEASEAYEIIGNAEKRKTYDQFGHAAFDQGAGGGNPFAGGNPFGGGPFTYSYSSGGGQGFGDFSDPFDIFESFFGGASPFRQAPQKTRYQIQIEFMDAINGAERSLVHQGKNYTIKVPAGADDGTRIRYNDFDLIIRIKPHKQFKREGYDIVVDQDISFVQAILGDNIEIPTLEKPLKIKIRPGTQPGSILRLQGKGVKHLQRSGHGDLYVRLIITMPKSLNKQQKDLLKKFQETLK